MGQITNLQLESLYRGCARGGHGVIGAHFAKMTPNFGFVFELWGIPGHIMTLKVCILIPNFLSLAASGVIHDPSFKTWCNP